MIMKNMLNFDCIGRDNQILNVSFQKFVKEKENKDIIVIEM